MTKPTMYRVLLEPEYDKYLNVEMDPKAWRVVKNISAGSKLHTGNYETIFTATKAAKLLTRYLNEFPEYDPEKARFVTVNVSEVADID